MTHQPPVPEGNQSPYPLQQPPQAKSDGPPAGSEIARTPEKKSVRPALVGGLVAAGVAALAAVGAWTYATTPKYKRKERRRKKAQ